MFATEDKEQQRCKTVDPQLIVSSHKFSMYFVNSFPLPIAFPTGARISHRGPIQSNSLKSFE